MIHLQSLIFKYNPTLFNNCINIRIPNEINIYLGQIQLFQERKVYRIHNILIYRILTFHYMMSLFSIQQKIIKLLEHNIKQMIYVFGLILQMEYQILLKEITTLIGVSYKQQALMGIISQPFIKSQGSQNTYGFKPKIYFGHHPQQKIFYIDDCISNIPFELKKAQYDPLNVRL
ncbi:unnamed protein product [Paramecium sonneborni]|uniref:Uncharacterized protein n=1 Tax=Paramecium sonneborni TaxID=65129 RepID=A0A8S1Q125_9CILI|nr:unnamed protein product [Paramecium sonneborni]